MEITDILVTKMPDISTIIPLDLILKIFATKKNSNGDIE